MVIRYQNGNIIQDHNNIKVKINHQQYDIQIEVFINGETNQDLHVMFDMEKILNFVIRANCCDNLDVFFHNNKSYNNKLKFMQLVISGMVSDYIVDCMKDSILDIERIHPHITNQFLRLLKEKYKHEI